MDEIKHTVEEKVLKELHHKIDKHSFRMVNNSMRKKIDKIQKEIEEMSKINEKGNEYANSMSTIFKTNEKCISCNRRFEPETKDTTVDEKVNKKKFLFKEIYKNAPKLGSGYSRILGTLGDPEEMDMLAAEGSCSKNDDSNYLIPSVDIHRNMNHMSGIMRNHRRNNSITNKPIPKV